ncbi:MAG: LysR family transcriptional regulator [Hyphomicrobiaceae bacterium]|nr:LysR family transcriptional regulator [Hyphomicrobiaceae bacterium]
MDIQDLRIFARLARLQNLSAVGAEFELSAGTISKRLQALEAELSLRLFDRTTRSISITEEGAKLLADIERILDQLDDALAGVSAHVEQPKGRLRVSAPTSLVRGVIAPAICTFMLAYDEIELQIDLTDRTGGMADGGYDVAIRTGELEDSSLVAKRLAADPQVIVAAPRYLEDYGLPLCPEDLARHSCLLLGEGQYWRLERRGVPVDTRVSGRLRSDNSDLLRHAALEGLGVLRISRHLVADDIRAGLLQSILSDYDAGTRSAIWAVYPSSRHILPKLRVFVDFMTLWFREDGAPSPSLRHEINDLMARLNRQSVGRAF